jgi:bacterioferritin (cytochrome b1)
MSSTMWRLMMALLVGLVTTVGLHAQQMPNLMPYLQAEVNEIATLSVQSNYLMQQGDPLGASLVASYIPDHQMMVNMLSAAIRAQGGNPGAIQAQAAAPTTGTRLELIRADMAAHQRVIDQYQNLLDTATDPAIRQLATLGLGGASRHFASLNVARGATLGTPEAIASAMLSALTLERMAVNDLQVQAAQLDQLGNQSAATTLRNLIPAHQQQVARLESLVTQLGGNPALAIPPPVAPLQTADNILLHQRILDTQFVNTYAMPIAALPPSPLRTAALQGQSIALYALSLLGQQPALA